MAKGPFIDSETGARRQREQRPDGLDTRYRIQKTSLLLPRGTEVWEIYHCLADGCVFDTQWTEQFDIHYYYHHELPRAREQAIAETAARARDDAERQKELEAWRSRF